MNKPKNPHVGTTPGPTPHAKLDRERHREPNHEPQRELDRALVWLRRDLRVEDNAALHHALRAARQVWVCFVFDRDILDLLPRQDRRVEFIRDSLVGVDAELRAAAASHGVAGVGLIVRHGWPRQEIPALVQALGAQAVYANHDDEPAATARDAQVRGRLADLGVALHTSKDHVVFERSEVMTQGATAFSVFTPYKNAWLKKVDRYFLSAYAVSKHAAALAPAPTAGSVPSSVAGTVATATAAISASAYTSVPGLVDIGFAPTNLHQLKLPSGPAGARELLADFLPRLDAYQDTRDFPAVKGPSYLSTHLRFGTVSIRQLAREAHARSHGVARGQAPSRGAEVWLSELIWRDFYHQVLHHHPHVVERAFKPAYDRIEWDKGKAADALFAAWCEGRTGYPLVDAAMMQINQTGYMHNRLRMVVASFLTKDLGLHWHRGEAYFALHLNDFDLAANNGGWQWAASSGCDAQPYFRIFNPVSQSERFDPQGRFIRRYLPQLGQLPDKLIHAPWLARPIDLAGAGITLGKDYPMPVVDHATAREKTLQRYAVVKG